MQEASATREVVRTAPSAAARARASLSLASLWQLRSRIGGAEIAVAIAVTLVAFRFWAFDLVPFINDEAHFLEAARQQVLTGHWVSVSPIAGTQGLKYGPSVMWFYGVVQTVFGFRAKTAVFAMCLVVTAAQSALAGALARAFKGGAITFAVLLAFIASSPYQYFWSRLAWDPLVDVLSALTVVLFAVDEIGKRRALLLGAVMGLALSSHLMVTPFVMAVFGVWALEVFRAPKRVLTTMPIALVAGFVVNVPYLLYLKTVHPTVMPPPPTVETTLFEYFLQPARIAGIWRIDYLFDAEWSTFQAWVGKDGAFFFDVFATPLPIAALAFTGLVVGSLRARTATQARIARLALLTWVGYAYFFYMRRLTPHPHYQFPTWWTVPAGIAALLAWLRPRSLLAWRGARHAVFALALVQFAFLVVWEHFLREHGGTHGIHYSTPLVQQTRVIRQACAAAGPALDVVDQTSMYPVTLQYIAATEPVCAGKDVRVCDGACSARAATHATIRYAAPQGGAIALDLH